MTEEDISSLKDDIWQFYDREYEKSKTFTPTHQVSVRARASVAEPLPLQPSPPVARLLRANGGPSALRFFSPQCKYAPQWKHLVTPDHPAPPRITGATLFCSGSLPLPHAAVFSPTPRKAVFFALRLCCAQECRKIHSVLSENEYFPSPKPSRHTRPSGECLGSGSPRWRERPLTARSTSALAKILPTPRFSATDSTCVPGLCVYGYMCVYGYRCFYEYVCMHGFISLFVFGG